MMKFLLVLLTALFFLWTSDQAVFAAPPPPTPPQPTPNFVVLYVNSLTGTCTTEEIAGIFCVVGKVINLLIGVVGAVAVLYMVYGGIMYMASGGDMKQLESAKAAITYSLLGLAITIGAILVVNTILAGLIG